jgi:hypothetical protein
MVMMMMMRRRSRRRRTEENKAGEYLFLIKNYIYLLKF